MVYLVEGPSCCAGLAAEVRQQRHDGNLVIPPVQNIPHLHKHRAAPCPPVLLVCAQHTRQLQGAPSSPHITMEVTSCTVMALWSKSKPCPSTQRWVQNSKKKKRAFYQRLFESNAVA